MHDLVVLKALQNCRGKLSFGCILCTFCVKPGSLHFSMVSGEGVYGTSILCHRVWYPGSNTQESILGNYYQEPIPINPWIHELINPSTHQSINPSTLAFCITVYSTREPISGNQYSGTTTRNPSSSTHESMNSLIHQPINPSIHQLCMALWIWFLGWGNLR